MRHSNPVEMLCLTSETIQLHSFTGCSPACIVCTSVHPYLTATSMTCVRQMICRHQHANYLQCVQVLLTRTSCSKWSLHAGQDVPPLLLATAREHSQSPKQQRSRPKTANPKSAKPNSRAVRPTSATISRRGKVTCTSIMHYLPSLDCIACIQVSLLAQACLYSVCRFDMSEPVSATNHMH